MSLFHKLAVAGFALVVSNTAVATTSISRIDYLGQTRIDKSTDKDTVVIRSCNDLNRKVARIKLRFTRNPATLYRVKVKFGDGSTQVFRGNQYFREGETTGWLNMMGGYRCVNRVEIKANGSGGSSIIEIYGETIRAD